MYKSQFLLIAILLWKGPAHSHGSPQLAYCRSYQLPQKIFNLRVSFGFGRSEFLDSLEKITEWWEMDIKDHPWCLRCFFYCSFSLPTLSLTLTEPATSSPWARWVNTTLFVPLYMLIDSIFQFLFFVAQSMVVRDFFSNLWLNFCDFSRGLSGKTWSVAIAQSLRSIVRYGPFRFLN